MVKVVHLILFLAITYNVKCNSLNPEDSQNALQSLNAYLKRKGENEQKNGCENTLFLPPTLNIDIDSLIRWAKETQIGPIGPDSSNMPHQLVPPEPPVPPVRPESENRGFASRPTDEKSNPSSEEVYDIANLDILTFEGKSYLFNSKQKMSWTEAMSFCRAFGMDLVSVESVAENDFIVGQLKHMGLSRQYTWTSGNKIGRSSYLWINGNKLIYNNWRVGEPNLPKTEHCIMYFHLQWYDFPCQSHEVYSICEDRKLNK